MSPLKDNTQYITIENGGIDYAFYENRARIRRSEAILAIAPWFKRLSGDLRQRLSLSRPTAPDGLAAGPCG